MGVSLPQVTVVAVTEHPDTSEVLVVLQDVDAEVGQETHTSVTVLVAVQPPVTAVLRSSSCTSQPYTEAHVEITLDVVVMVAVCETDTPFEVLVAHS